MQLLGSPLTNELRLSWKSVAMMGTCAERVLKGLNTLEIEVSQPVPNEDEFVSFWPNEQARATHATQGEPQFTRETIQSGRQIGPYKLLMPLGEGGMGSVWMAEQSEPVKRRVALKLIKNWGNSKEILAQFEAERQALAMMNHPNIAQILDAGTTPEGQPFFAMELVQGQALTNYCDENRLDLNDRLRLFAEACNGVQHAHQKGIIHRDLKPSNILVAMVDGKPVVKVIDFGLAKAIESTQQLTDRSLFTGIGQIMGTLKYMSPEQAKLGSLDVDTRTDVYALGVLLYELLTGATPLADSVIKEEAVLNVLTFIRESDPVKPSRRLSSCSHEQISKVTNRRNIDPSRLSRILAGDLDWIVMKALEKDRTRRYDSASAFADDILRFIRNEPVLARPPSFTYQIRKFASKNRVGVVAFLLVLFSLLAGIAGTTWGMLRALNAEAIANERTRDAEEERKRSELTKQRALQSLGSVQEFVLDSPVWRTKNPGREALIDLIADEYEFWGTESGEFDDDIPTLAPALVRLAALEFGVGRYEKAAVMAKRGIDLLARRTDDSSPEFQLSMAEAEALLLKIGFFKQQSDTVDELKDRVESRLARIPLEALELAQLDRFCQTEYSLIRHYYYVQYSRQTYSKAVNYRDRCGQLLKRFPQSPPLRFHLSKSLSLMALALHKYRATEVELETDRDNRLALYDRAESIGKELMSAGFRPLDSRQLVAGIISNRGLALRQEYPKGTVTAKETLKNYDQGLAICSNVLADYPDNLLFQETKGLLLLNKADFLSDLEGLEYLEVEAQIREEAYQLLSGVTRSTAFNSVAGERLALNQLGYIANQYLLGKKDSAYEFAKELFSLKPDLNGESPFRILLMNQLLLENKSFSSSDEAKLKLESDQQFRKVVSTPGDVHRDAIWNAITKDPLFATYRENPEFDGDWERARGLRAQKNAANESND